MAIGWTQILLVFGLILLLFGSKRIPEVARALGTASREFKNARDSVIKEVNNCDPDAAPEEDGSDHKEG